MQKTMNAATRPDSSRYSCDKQMLIGNENINEGREE